MFSCVTQFLYRFESHPVRTIAAVMLGSLVRWLRRRHDRPDRWPALLTGSIAAGGIYRSISPSAWPATPRTATTATG